MLGPKSTFEKKAITSFQIIEDEEDEDEKQKVKENADLRD